MRIHEKENNMTAIGAGAGLVKMVWEGRLVFLLLAGICAASTGVAADGAQMPPQMRYVAPEARGDASGSAPEHAADFRNMTFWGGINALLEAGSVQVVFLNGRYVVSADKDKNMPSLTLRNIGHDAHLLALHGETPGEVVFTRHADDPDYSRENNKGPGFLAVQAGRNIVVRNLTFTAPNKPIGYATNFRGRNIVIENCHWHDLDGVYYGASGASGAETDTVTFVRCRFERVGSGGHAHMVYNAYDPRHIRFVDCHFEDCAGDYIRFRDNTEYGVVTGCTFRSTGKYTNVHMPFIAMPLFNDDDPAKSPAKPNYEYFGTHFLIFNNRFIYDTEDKPDTRIAIVFHHSGYDPPDRRHLLDAQEAAVLKTGAPDARKAILKQNLGVDTDTVHVYDNEYGNVQHKGVYRARAQYGAVSRGGDGMYDIFDLFNTQAVVKNVEDALMFFK